MVRRRVSSRGVAEMKIEVPNFISPQLEESARLEALRKRILKLEARLEKRTTIELDFVEVRKYDHESLWLQRPDGEGMQLIINEKWWKDNM